MGERREHLTTKRKISSSEDEKNLVQYLRRTMVKDIGHGSPARRDLTHKPLIGRKDQEGSCKLNKLLDKGGV